MTNSEFLKHAYQLGYQHAWEQERKAEHEKSAGILTSLGGGLARLLGKGISAGVPAAGRGLASAAASAVPVAKNIANVGRLLTYGGGPLGTKFMGSGLLSNVVPGAALGGTFNALLGDDSKPWYQRYGEGALGGAAAGAGWWGGGKLMRGAMQSVGQSKWLQQKAPNFAKRWTAAAGGKGIPHDTFTGPTGIWAAMKSGAPVGADTAKRLGMYALTGAPIAAGAWYGSSFADEAARKAMGNGDEAAAADVRPYLAYQAAQRNYQGMAG